MTMTRVHEIITRDEEAQFKIGTSTRIAISSIIKKFLKRQTEPEDLKSPNLKAKIKNERVSISAFRAPKKESRALII